MSSAHLAFDLGAGSGRAIVGLLDDDLQLAEVHRFEHAPCDTPTGPVWDLTGIWHHLMRGLKSAVGWCEEQGVPLRSLGVDTWGVDWGLLGKQGELLALPHAYRDPRNEAACRRTLERLGGFDRLYDRNGIQLLAFNTLFQVVASHEQEPELFRAADRLMMLPDILHYWLTGTAINEQTIASTSAMLDLTGNVWDKPLLEELDIPTHLFHELVPPGTPVGPLRGDLARATGADANLLVVTPASHDTASAIAAVPVTASDSWAYLSSGTWSLLGAELSEPLTTPAARAVPFTNERGVAGTVRFLKNIGGLWLVQEVRRELNEAVSFETLTAEAEAAEPFRTLIDPNHASFSQPGQMAEKICRFAQESGQPVPDQRGALVRCCLDSLALSYRETLDQLESVLGSPISHLHVVGGGTQNQLLNRLTTDAVARPTFIGPIEATAIGNLLVQAQGCGIVTDLAELRAVVARSFPCTRLEVAQACGPEHREAYHAVIGV